MHQKEDLVHQSDQNVWNSPKWFKKLTMILTSVLLLTMFAIGGYWWGARQQRSFTIIFIIANGNQYHQIADCKRNTPFQAFENQPACRPCWRECCGIQHTAIEKESPLGFG
jgi:hypothetical protein